VKVVDDRRGRFAESFLLWGLSAGLVFPVVSPFPFARTPPPPPTMPDLSPILDLVPLRPNGRTPYDPFTTLFKPSAVFSFLFSLLDHEKEAVLKACLWGDFRLPTPTTSGRLVRFFFQPVPPPPRESHLFFQEMIFPKSGSPTVQLA